jgi:selenocysteine-specific elongation factor
VTALAPLLLGTAGHIDHGKTSLVRALTGIDTDRLAEEKARGITIELGFAHLDVAGRRFGLVDVPGHERFLRAMVAGATGMDLVLFVVAADAGVMPQTREHLGVCTLLGVRRGVIALTKVDLVDAELRSMIEEEVRALVAGTFLAEAPLVGVSTKTGEGLEELRTALGRAASTLPARSADGPWRLPVDRVFTLRGFGTVVTGTLASGEVRVGDEAAVGDVVGKVRSIQAHGEARERARAGTRCALNLAGVALDEVARGDVVAAPGSIVPSQILDVELRALAAPLSRRTKLLVHHGTAQAMGTFVLAGAESLEAGAEGFGQLRLDRPIAALPGDRFLVRGFRALPGHGTTLGGGVIVRAVASKSRGRSDSEIRRFAEAGRDERVALELERAGPAGRTAPALSARLGFAAGGGLARLVAGREAIVEGGVYLHAATVARLEQAILDAIGGDGIAREELRSRLPHALPPRLFDAILAGVAGLELDRDRVTRRQARKPATPIAEKLLATLAAARLETPRPSELATSWGVPEAAVKTAIDAAVRAGTVVRIRPDYFVTAEVLAELRAALIAYLGTHAQIDAQGWKQLSGASRKYTIPLAEHFDAEKVTLRVGEVRRLRSSTGR